MILCGGLLFLLIYFIWAIRVWWRTVTKSRAIGGRRDNTGGEWAPWSNFHGCSHDSGTSSHHDSGSSFDFGGGDFGGGGDGGGGAD